MAGEEPRKEDADAVSRVRVFKAPQRWGRYEWPGGRIEFLAAVVGSKRKLAKALGMSEPTVYSWAIGARGSQWKRPGVRGTALLAALWADFVLAGVIMEPEIGENSRTP